MRIVIEKKAEDEEDKPSSEYDEIDNPQPTKQELKELLDGLLFIPDISFDRPGDWSSCF